MELERPARTKEQVIRDFRTSEILGAARRVIAEIGFGEASMERIAQEAGISKGTIYLYFDGKEALLVEALKRGFDLLMERTRSAARRARGSRAKLRAVVEAGLEASEDQRAFFESLEDWPQLGPEGASLLREHLRPHVEAYIHFLVGLIERGIRSGAFRQVDARRVARALLELTRGAIVERLRQPKPIPTAEEVDAIVDIFENGIGAGERT